MALVLPELIPIPSRKRVLVKIPNGSVDNERLGNEILRSHFVFLHSQDVRYYCSLQFSIQESAERKECFEQQVWLRMAEVGSSPTLWPCSQGAINFAYSVYLRLRDDAAVSATDVKRYVQR